MIDLKILSFSVFRQRRSCHYSGFNKCSTLSRIHLVLKQILGLWVFTYWGFVMGLSCTNLYANKI